LEEDGETLPFYYSDLIPFETMDTSKIKFKFEDKNWEKLANAILHNVYLINPKGSWKKHSIERFIYIVNQENTSRKLAQLEFLLHASKSVDPIRIFSDFIDVINSFKFLENDTGFYDSERNKIVGMAKGFLGCDRCFKIMKEICLQVLGINITKQEYDNFLNILKIECFLANRKLAGFSGFSSIYINWTHFTSEYISWSMLGKEQQLISFFLTCDLLSVIGHETAHALLRYIVKDTNMSTPEKIRSCGKNNDIIEKKYQEAGRLFEMKLFGGVIPKWSENDIFTDDEMETIVASLLDNCILPPEFDKKKKNLIQKTGSSISGISYYEYSIIC